MANSHLGIFELINIPDALLTSRCSAVLSLLAAASEPTLLAALGDPRGIHKALYLDLVPEVCREIVGNYRGSDYSTLKNAVVFVAYNETEGTTDIAKPHRVQALMDEYAIKLRECGLRHAASLDQKLNVAADLMAFFGEIHPFLDGNGHVLRITVQCLLERAGVKMNSAWRIHPRPYGEEVTRAFAAGDLDKISAILRGFVE